MKAVDLNKLSLHTTVIDNKQFFMDENHQVYITRPSDDYGFEIYDANNKVVVANPDIYQKMYGLLNFLVNDNATNPYKQGHYRINDIDLFYDFKEDMNLLKHGKIYTPDQLEMAWAIDGGEVKVSCFDEAVIDIIETMPKLKEEELTL